jgi:hypothetical protein
MNKDESEMRILKTATCKSTSGKSTLTYQLGCTPDNAIHIRVTKSTGPGTFNDEWLATKDIQKALANGPKGQPLTSFLLQPLLSGGSSNTPAFIVAALTHERLLRVLKGKKRGHQFLDPEGFDAKMQKLVSSKVKPKVTASSTRKKAVTKKAPSKKSIVKKKSMVRKKASRAR